eukprot:Trichotokara_eunicae@DN3793_c0_g1_i4.p1
MGTKSAGRLRSFTDEFKCLGNEMKLTDCQQANKDAHWALVDEDHTIRFRKGDFHETCLTIVKGENDRGFVPKMEKCDGSSPQRWAWEKFERDPNFELPKFSEEYRKKRAAEEHKALE